MKNLLWMIGLFFFLFVGMTASAADYAIMRTAYVMPGGGTGTNVVVVPVPDSAQSADAEIIEVDAIGGAAADTCTVSRVSSDLKFTNALATATSPTVSFVTVTGTNSFSVSALGPSDFARIVETGTNVPTVAIYWKIHPIQASCT